MLERTALFNDFNDESEKFRFAAIYNEWHFRLCYFAFLQLKSRELAEDVVHDCFTSLLNRQNGFADILSVKSFLYRSVYNACINKIKANRKIYVLINNNSIVDTEEGIDAAIIRTELHGELYSAVERIPEKFSQVIKLYYFEDFKQREIAEKLNIPIQTVKSRRHRAIEYLRKRMLNRLTFQIVSVFK